MDTLQQLLELFAGDTCPQRRREHGQRALWFAHGLHKAGAITESQLAEVHEAVHTE